MSNGSRSASMAAFLGFLSGSVMTTAAFLSWYILTQPSKKRKNPRLRPQLQSSSSLKPTSAMVLSRSDQINFLSDLIHRLWSHLNLGASSMIREIVEPMFAEMMPSPFQSLHFTKLDLGHVPLSLDNIVVHPLQKTSDGHTVLRFDMDVTWNGKCDIQLSTKGSPALKLGVKDMTLIGRMQFVMNPLSNLIPCFDAIQYSFINSPMLDLNYTGLASIASMGPIDDTIQDILATTLSSMIVLPNRMCFKMNPCCDYRDAYLPPVGVVKITPLSGRGFQVEEKIISKDIPDVYLEISLADKKWKSSTVKDSLSPEWSSESVDFVLSDNDQIVIIKAWDYDSGALDADDFLGEVQVTVGELLLCKKGTAELELLDGQNVSSGASVTVRCEKLNFVPYAQIPMSLSDTGSINDGYMGGLVIIIVTQVFDLHIAKEAASSFVKITYGPNNKFSTGIVVDCPGFDAINPLYDAAFHVPITHDLLSSDTSLDQILPDVMFELMNGDGYGKNDVTLGTLTVKHEELMSLPDTRISQRIHIGHGGASIEFQVKIVGVEDCLGKTVFKKSTPSGGKNQTPSQTGLETQITIPDNSTDNAPSQAGLETPITLPDNSTDIVAAVVAAAETVQIAILSGKGFAIKKKTFGRKDVPDIYCQIKFGSSPRVWKTSTIKDEAFPIWDNEFQTYPLSNRNQVIHLDVYDANRKSEDEFIGSARITVGQILLNGGVMEVELIKEGNVETGSFIRLGCVVD